MKQNSKEQTKEEMILVEELNKCQLTSIWF